MRKYVLATTLLLLLPPIVAAQPTPHDEHHQKWLHAAIAASMIAHGADLSTTSWALGRGGNQFREANPLMRPFAGNPVSLAVVKMSVAVASNYILLKLHKRHPHVTMWVAVAQTLAIGYVAHRNAALIRGRGPIGL